MFAAPETCLSVAKVHRGLLGLGSRQVWLAIADTPQAKFLL